MARAFYMNDGAAWRQARSLWVHDGTAWRKARAVYVHDGTAWRQSAASQPVNFGGSVEAYRVSASGAAAVSVAFQADGSIALTRTESVQSTTYASWYDANEAGIGAGYWIRATLQSGSAPSSGLVLGTWYQLSAERSWTYTTTTTGAINTRAGRLLFEISSDSAGSAIVCSGSYDISATRET